MIKWLNNNIGTASYMEGAPYCEKHGDVCLDVRDLVDKSGNTLQSIRDKIEEGVQLLRKGNKIVICCDYGMSRSNSIAVGIIVKYESRPFEVVVEDVLEIIGEGAIKVEVLNMVRVSLDQQGTSESKSKILVTGASGFIGRGLVAELGQYACKVEALSSKEINLEEELVRLDLYVSKIRPSHIIHLANPRIYTCNGAMGKTLAMLKNILDICITHEVKLIYPSGWEVYSGYASKGLLASESLPLYSKGTYGETKYLCEQLIRNYGIQHDLSYSILRFPPLYGAQSDRPRFIYNFIDKALKNQPITTHIYNNGSPHLDLLCIDDAVKALSQIIMGNLDGEYNIGTGKIISTKKVAELIVEAVNSKSEILHSYIDGYAPNIIMDASKFKRQSDWNPTISFETWIVQQVRSIMNTR
ncbi:MAG TPA: NAD(P)-dependent oxidoreductase [Desulfosporosinus sp.]|nr:NAD(P)-dependent oxidoreductase [Desulfosporosinus sp.]